MFVQILRRALALFAVLLCCMPALALADDCVAIKLRGSVFMLVNDEWLEVKKGDVVPDSRVVRTARGARVELARGEEKLELGSNTQIRIFDKAGTKYTSVNQYFGTVTVEAEKRNVEHFAVYTPFLAAVVKGTKFRVWVDGRSSKVNVPRGRVEVRDTVNDLMVNVTPGQNAEVTKTTVLQASGKGPVERVTTFSGQPVDKTGQVIAAQNNGGSSGNAANAKANAVGNAVTGAGNAAAKAVGNVANGAANAAGNAANGAANAAGNAAAGAGNAVTGAGNAVGNTVSGAGNAVGNAVSEVGGAVGGAVGGLGGLL